jgi:hypothetical protein
MRKSDGLKKLTSRGKITVLHIERCTKIRYGIEDLSAHSLRNEFSKD